MYWIFISIPMLLRLDLMYSIILNVFLLYFSAITDLLIFPLISVFHILIHALSKSLLFLLAGSLIHIQLNFQSIYKIKINNSLIKNLFITGLIILIFSLSKEGIIHSSNSMYSSTFVYVLGLISGMLTIIYSLKIYIYCFYISYYGILYSSFILPMLTITSILINQCLDLCFSIFFFVDFGQLFSFIMFDSILHFTILFFFTIPLISPLLFKALITRSLFNHLFGNLFINRSSFFIPPFQYFFLVFSTYFFKAPIYCIELFIGCSPCYSLYYIHYVTSFQFILFFMLYSYFFFFL